MTRILVTGGAGYVGAVSVGGIRRGRARRRRPGRPLDRPPFRGTGRGALDHRRATPTVRPRRPQFAEEAIDAILHCAARSLIGESIAEPARYFGDNVGGGDRVPRGGAQRRRDALRAFVERCRLRGPGHTPIPEDAPLRPINPYGESKRSLEAAIAWYGRAYGMRTVSLRYFNVAGATDVFGEDHDPETHLIPAILGAVEAGAPSPSSAATTRPATARRARLHPRDRSRRCPSPRDRSDRGRRRRPADRRRPLVCNLGNGDGFTNLEVLRAAEAIVGRAISRPVGPRRPGDPPTLVASATRAADVLDWRPQRPRLEEMVRSAWAWRQAHPGGYAD